MDIGFLDNFPQDDWVLIFLTPQFFFWHLLRITHVGVKRGYMQTNVILGWVYRSVVSNPSNLSRFYTIATKGSLQTSVIFSLEFYMIAITRFRSDIR